MFHLLSLWAHAVVVSVAFDLIITYYVYVPESHHGNESPVSSQSIPLSEARSFRNPQKALVVPRALNNNHNLPWFISQSTIGLSFEKTHAWSFLSLHIKQKKKNSDKIIIYYNGFFIISCLLLIAIMSSCYRSLARFFSVIITQICKKSFQWKRNEEKKRNQKQNGTN